MNKIHTNSMDEANFDILILYHEWYTFTRKENTLYFTVTTKLISHFEI